MKVVVVWRLAGGSARYRVTVRRFAWLKPMVHKVSDMVWVPTRVEILRIEAHNTAAGTVAHLAADQRRSGH